MATYITGAVEGPTDEAVLTRLIVEAGGEVAAVYGRKGKQHLLAALDGYNAAARHAPWAVLVDLDTSHECAPTLVATALPNRSDGMRLRVAVRQVEAWLLADSERIARYLGVKAGLVPRDPDELPNAKDALVNLARGTSRRAIREDMVPAPGSGISVGPAYASRIIQFVRDTERGWRPDSAAIRSPSLARARRSIAELLDS